MNIWRLCYNEETNNLYTQMMTSKLDKSNIYDENQSYFINEIDAQKACEKVNADLVSGILKIYKCKDCGIYFYTNKSEEEWFLDRGLIIPKRCQACRKKRRIEATNKISNL